MSRLTITDSRMEGIGWLLRLDGTPVARVFPESVEALRTALPPAPGSAPATLPPPEIARLPLDSAARRNLSDVTRWLRSLADRDRRLHPEVAAWAGTVGEALLARLDGREGIAPPSTPAPGGVAVRGTVIDVLDAEDDGEPTDEPEMRLSIGEWGDEMLAPLLPGVKVGDSVRVTVEVVPAADGARGEGER